MLFKLRALCAAVTLALGLVPSFAFAQATQVPPGEVCFSAVTGISGMIGTLGTITPGSNGTNGTYVNVPLTGGSGSGATANVTVSGGGVTNIAVLNPGLNYVVGDILSAVSANIGNVSGFSVPVASISINSSLAGGSVGFYVPNTLTYSQTWQDSGETVLNPNPITLDANGCATIYGTGLYRQILYDSLGNEVWDKLTSPLPSGLVAGVGISVTTSGGSTTIANTGVLSLGAVTGAITTSGDLSCSAGNCTVNHGQLMNTLTANVPLNNTANYFDGPSVAQGTTGTWYASGTVSLTDTSGAALFLCKLWDGTTVISSSLVEMPTLNYVESIALSGFITSPAGNIRISCRDNSSTSGEILATDTGGQTNDSTITAFRLQ